MGGSLGELVFVTIDKFLGLWLKVVSLVNVGVCVCARVTYYS